MTLIYQQQENVVISGGEVLQQCTNNIEHMASLPGNPQAYLFVKLHPEDVKGLNDNQCLRMNLLDFILHSTCTYSCDTRGTISCLGGTVTRQWLEWMVMPIRGPMKQEIFEKYENN